MKPKHRVIFLIILLSSGFFGTIPNAQAVDTIDVEYLVIGGGGGGGGGSGGGGGGGGAGGYKTNTVAIGVNTFTVTVGAGGSAGADGVKGSLGGDSVFDTITSLGGGGGSGYNAIGDIGGSGGGGSASGTTTAGIAGTAGQGYAGGSGATVTVEGSGGGGGASAIGTNADGSAVRGVGGAGSASSITGSSITRGGGGGGAGGSANTSGGEGGAGGGGAGSERTISASVAGTANTGGGGGGGAYDPGGWGSSAGGSGIVIVRYLTAEATATGGAITYDGAYSIHTFTTSGTFEITDIDTTPRPDSITDLSLDSSTQTTATVSFTPPNLNTGNLTTYTFNLDTPQNNNVLTFKANSTDNPYIITGLTLGTSYSANATAITEGGANYTLANILNFTTPTFTLPGAPTLSATALSDVALRFTSVLGTAGDNSTKDFSLRCELNGAGGWLNSVNNNTYASFYEYSGLTLGDVLICQWRDGSADGWGAWSNNATDTLTLAILSAQRGIADTDDKLMQFINMVSGMGGVYFGLGVLPFGIMLIGFMAGKKTVRIFTLATLMLMGIVHASGYYVYPNWYWTLCLLFGLVLIMGRMKSD